MIYAAHATARNGTMSRIEVEATNRQEACAQVFAKFPPCTLESVCAWPVGETRLVLDALSLRLSANPVCHAAFGTLC